MPFKFTMFFNFGGSGFSETWYNTQSGNISSLNPAPFDQLAEARDALCAAQVNLVGYRITDMTNPRQTYTRNYPPVTGATAAPDTISNAQLAIVHGANGVGRRQFWMRGMVDDWTEYDLTTSSWKVIPAFQTRYQNFVSRLTNVQNGWAIQTIQPRKGGTGLQIVDHITAQAGTSSALLSVPDGSIYNSLNIIVSGFKKPLSRLNGTYIYPTGYNWGATTIQLPQKFITAAQATAYPTSTASVRTRVTALTNITQLQLDAPRSRRCGRAFFVPRGRRSAR